MYVSFVIGFPSGVIQNIANFLRLVCIEHINFHIRSIAMSIAIVTASFLANLNSHSSSILGDISSLPLQIVTKAPSTPLLKAIHMFDWCGTDNVVPVNIRVTVAVSDGEFLLGDVHSVVPKDGRDGKYDSEKYPPWRSELLVVDCADRIVVAEGFVSC